MIAAFAGLAPLLPSAGLSLVYIAVLAKAARRRRLRALVLPRFSGFAGSQDVPVRIPIVVLFTVTGLATGNRQAMIVSVR